MRELFEYRRSTREYHDKQNDEVPASYYEHGEGMNYAGQTSS